MSFYLAGCYSEIYRMCTADILGLKSADHVVYEKKHDEIRLFIDITVWLASLIFGHFGHFVRKKK